mmetsp:Transcript_105982/g.167321  ORF Transcript_105982/g.167321 Transcript_105982/m.167321 type:complete len:699 (-) Transcript_105982:148-2244(-)|eukprot:CAMPEP_0169123592 /NCGR_PEP_ID=MMETSP1015-20121227/33869_1 /TAXON_ID=342587 /ORGANISM="Karlodinium micrum, Strain CCMP2283" /LENGTH=698 /DNA_ID=CAMNT_0009186943 /DNA_START=70 /DNA_END=2166 /DNA_ORIENTATION=-
MTDWVVSRSRKTASSGTPRKRQSDRFPVDGRANTKRSSRNAGKELAVQLSAREGNAIEGAGRPNTADRGASGSSRSRMNVGSFSSSVEPQAPYYGGSHPPLPPHFRETGVSRGAAPWSAHSLGHGSTDVAVQRPPEKARGPWTDCASSDNVTGAIESYASFDNGAPEPLPPRPSTPCMNRGDGARRKRTSSAGASSRRSNRPSSGSVGARMSELENALLARSRQAVASSMPRPGAPEPSWSESRSGRESVLGTAVDPEDAGFMPLPPAAVEPSPPPGGCMRSRPSSSCGRAAVLGVRPSSSLGRPSGAGPFGAPLSGGAQQILNAPASLIEEAMLMCRSARQPTSAESPPSPVIPVERPTAPTPEQTNHWLHGMDDAAERLAAAERAAVDARESRGASSEHQPTVPVVGCESWSKAELLRQPGQVHDVPRPGSPDSPRSMPAICRPRSPTPTKMLAWEEAHCDSDHEGCGDHTDGLIAQLIGACQVNDISKAFTFYEKLRQMQVPLYEGVYKMIIECCMRTQQLGHAMQFYETLKVSGQKMSSRLAVVLIEALANEQHGDKIHTIWSDWCPPGDPVTASDTEVLLVVVSALIRTLSPDLAQHVLRDAMQRSEDRLASCLSDAEVDVEELLILNEQVAEEAKANGTLWEQLAGQFGELHFTLQDLLEQCISDSRKCGNSMGAGELIMEDVDVDLELAAM